jgi:hypothetical protein
MVTMLAITVAACGGSKTSSATTPSSTTTATATESSPSVGYSTAVVSGFKRSCNVAANQSLPESKLSAANAAAVRHDVAAYCTCALGRMEAIVPADRFARDMLAVLNGKATVPSYVLDAEHVCLVPLRLRLQALKG